MKVNVPKLLVAVVVCALFASAASARPKRSAPQMQKPAAKQNQPNRQQDQARQQAESAAVNAAQKTLTDAQSALNAVTVKARTEFEKSPEYVAAENELKADQSAYQAAELAVSQKADTDPGYIAAKAQSDKVRAELEALKADSTSPPDAVLAKSTELLEVSSAGHKFETDAVAADPTASAAHEKLLSAQKAVEAMKTAFHANLSKTPEYITAKSAVDAADKQLVAAQRGQSSQG